MSIFSQLSKNGAILKKLMDDGVMIKGDPEIVALEFIAPVSLMIQLHDREPDRKKEILKTIRKHMDEFIKNHCRE